MSATYTVKEVANILGFSTNSIYGFLKDGRIQGVRMGKGRFRIPEQELARVLHLSKKPQEEEVKQEPEITPAHFLTHIEAEDSLSLFDWFIAGIALLTSFSTLLYSPSLSILRSIGLGPILAFVASLCVVAAIGLCLTDFRAGIKSVWRNPFLIVLLLCFILLAILHAINGDPLYGILLGIVAVVIITHIIGKLRSMISLCLITCGFILAYPLVVLLFPQYVWFPVVGAMGNQTYCGGR